MLRDAFLRTRHVVPVWLWPWVWVQLAWIAAWMDREAGESGAQVSVMIAVLPSGRVRILFVSKDCDRTGGLGKLKTFRVPKSLDLSVCAFPSLVHGRAGERRDKGEADVRDTRGEGGATLRHRTLFDTS